MTCIRSCPDLSVSRSLRFSSIIDWVQKSNVRGQTHFTAKHLAFLFYVNVFFCIVHQLLCICKITQWTEKDPIQAHLHSFLPLIQFELPWEELCIARRRHMETGMEPGVLGYLVVSPVPAETQQLLVLPCKEVHRSVLQQG